MIIKSVKRVRTSADFLMNLLWVAFFWLIFGVFFQGTPTFWAGVLVVLLAASAAFGIYQLLLSESVKRRDKIIALYGAEQEFLHTDKIAKGYYDFYLSALDDKEGVRNKSFRNLIRGDDWVYGDFSFDQYKRTKYGDYLSSTTYYAVIATKLPRALPHVFFDSLQSRGRQFKGFFASTQIHQLEGDFDKHFVTYFPSYYTIDSMSFVSPEVMLALEEASEYDIEIIGDYVFMFGDLRDPRQQVPEMAKLITNIKDKLLHNIVTYRDENMPYRQGRQAVTEMGGYLARNLEMAYLQVCAGLSILIIGLAFAYHAHAIDAGINALFFAVAIGATGAVKIIKEQSRRRKVAAAFRWQQAANNPYKKENGKK